MNRINLFPFHICSSSAAEFPALLRMACCIAVIYVLHPWVILQHCGNDYTKHHYVYLTYFGEMIICSGIKLMKQNIYTASDQKSII